MTKTYRPYNPGQIFLLPPSLQEWLPKEHLAYFLLDVVAELDLSKIHAHYERERRGFPPHNPTMMVALLLYAYCVGVPSSRKIEKRTHEDVAFRVITADTHPDHVCISEFRRIHLSALSELFVQVLRLCQKAGLVELGVVALDGTKIKANASKHKAMSYERMKTEEERLTAKVAELLAAAEAADAQEDARHGKGRRGDELPEELRRAEERRARIRALKAELEAEAREQESARKLEEQEAAQVQAAVTEMANVRAAQAASDDSSDDDDDEPPPPPAVSSPEELPRHQVPTDKTGAPTPKAQRNFTDADSRIMKTGDGYVQGYNAQIAVGGKRQVIVAQGVSNQPPDVEYLIPMLDRVVDNVGKPDKAVADAGYFSEANIARASSRGVDLYVATGRTRHSEEASESPPDSDDATAKARMRAKLASDEGDRAYRRRKVLAEPPFGQIKNRGFRQFLLRGIEKVRGEWSLITLSHNLLKLHGARVAT